MIGLLWDMVRGRRAQFALSLVLAALATAAAVATPACLGTVEEQIVAGHLAAASTVERTVELAATVPRLDVGFEQSATPRLAGPGLTQVFSSEITMIPAGPEKAPPADSRRVGYRQDLCDHVVVVAGRCLMGAMEVVVNERAAAGLGVRLGDALDLAAGAYIGGEEIYRPAGDPARLTVVGVVRARDAAEPYWCGTVADAAGADRAGVPFYVSRVTLNAIDHPDEEQHLAGYFGPGGITVAALPALRAWLAAAGVQADGSPALGTRLPDLIAGIDADLAQARATAAVAAVPLAALSWALIVFAAAAAARARRQELGVVALRGVTGVRRGWFAAAETALAVLVGAPIGYLAVAVLSGRYADPLMLLAAGVTTAGALVVAVAAQLRSAGRPVAELLRETERRPGLWRSLTVEILVVVLAVAAVVQVQARGGTLSGVALLAPPLVMLAIGLLAARLAGPLAARIAGRALHRGRLVTALTATRLARQPTGQRLLALLVVAFGLLGFAATATDVSAATVARAADLATGAPTVLTVRDTTRSALLAATRAVDPGGKFAMAAVPLPVLSTGAPPVLAVDSARLPAVAIWHPDYAALPPRDLAARLQAMTVPEPVRLRGTTLTVELTLADAGTVATSLYAVLAPDNGGPAVALGFGALFAGRHTYQAHDPSCAAGCRLVALRVGVATAVGPVCRLTVHRLDADGTPADLARHWEAPPSATAATTADGLALTLPSTGRSSAGTVRPADLTVALPVLSTGPLPPDGAFGLFDGVAVTAGVAAPLHAVPGLGRHGTLVDLERADLLSTDSGVVKEGQVWLAAGAPATVESELAAHGLTVVARHTVADERAALGHRGAPLALRFFLVAGALAALLGAAGTVVVAASSADAYGPLRIQGMPRRVTARTDAATALGVVAAGVVAGLLAALVAWATIGLFLPSLSIDAPRPSPAPLWTVLAAGAALAVTALAAQLTIRPRAARRNARPVAQPARRPHR
ncbi:hypothetical protein [Dactylosporangium sp. CA-139066]|uniref:hypothetical protein n=1 Tax=Dactylosporangium sp. CA-139066 TaxID=3239930 RepID=UPI003D91332D